MDHSRSIKKTIRSAWLQARLLLKSPDIGVWLGLMLFIAGCGIIYYSLGYNTAQPVAATEYHALPSGEELVVQEMVGDTAQAVPTENKLRIDRIGVNAVIHEGGEEQLAFGIWHLPRTSTPDQGGNTVLSGHRWAFEREDGRSLYDLDELQIGDAIEVTWEGELYRYRMVADQVVSPDQVEILTPTDDARLTLFTCTPLFSTANRLVITATLDEVIDLPTDTDHMEPTEHLGANMPDQSNWRRWKVALGVFSLR